MPRPAVYTALLRCMPGASLHLNPLPQGPLTAAPSATTCPAPAPATPQLLRELGRGQDVGLQAAREHVLLARQGGAAPGALHALPAAPRGHGGLLRGGAAEGTGGPGAVWIAIVLKGLRRLGLQGRGPWEQCCGRVPVDACLAALVCHMHSGANMWRPVCTQY